MKRIAQLSVHCSLQGGLRVGNFLAVLNSKYSVHQLITAKRFYLKGAGVGAGAEAAGRPSPHIQSIQILHPHLEYDRLSQLGHQQLSLAATCTDPPPPRRLPQPALYSHFTLTQDPSLTSWHTQILLKVLTTAHEALHCTGLVTSSASSPPTPAPKAAFLFLKYAEVQQANLI